MHALCHRDWLALHEALLELHAAGEIADLPGRILGAVCRLVPCDIATLQDDRGGLADIPWIQGPETAWQPERDQAWRRGVRVMTDWNLRFHRLREAFFAHSGELHPHTAFYRRTGDGSTRRLSDLMPTRQLRGTQFYHEISRPTRIRWQLTAYEALPQGGTFMLAANRVQTDFSGRECALFEVLRAHAGRAWQRAVARERERARWQSSAHHRTEGAPVDDAAARAALRRRHDLTDREAQVLCWLSQGKTNEEIGLILGISRFTVKTHVEHVFAKLGCETRTAAARVALTVLG